MQNFLKNGLYLLLYAVNLLVCAIQTSNISETVMFCKYGDGDYVPYDTVVAEDRLADVVDIRFEGLKKPGFQTTVSKVNWKSMPNVKKIEGVETDFINYIFPKQSLPKLEKVVFERSNLSPGTLKSLLDAVPNIDSGDRAGNFEFTWDPFSALGFVEMGDEFEEDAFFTEFERVEKIQAKQKEHELLSGSTVIPQYEEADSEISSVNMDALRAYYLDGQEEVEENEPEIFIQYSIDRGTNYKNIAPKDFEEMSAEARALITDIEIDAVEGRPLLSAMSFDGCTQLTSLSISNAIIDGTFLVAPSLPKLTSLTLDSCGVNEEGVGYFLSNGTSLPDIQMRNIAKEDGSTFVDSYDEDEAESRTLLGEQKEILEFQQALQTRYKHISHISSSASTEPLFTTEYADEEYTDESSQTSSDEFLSGHAVASSRKTPTANSHAINELFRRNLDPHKASRLGMSDAASSEGSIKISRVHPVSVDDSMSEDSLEVSKKPKKSSTHGKTKRTTSDSTLSEMDVRDRGKTTVGHRVEVEPWDGADETPLVAPLLMQAVTSDSVKKIVVTWGQDSSSSMGLTLKQFKELPTETKQDIQTMTIIGGGSGSSNVVSAIDWSNLSGLESLTISNATVIGSLDDSIQFDNLTYILFENCGVDSSAFESFSNASQNLEEMDAKALYGLRIGDNSWRDLNESENELIRNTLKSVNIYDTDFDSSIHQKVNPGRSPSMNLGEPEDDDFELDSLSEGESPRSRVPRPLSPSFKGNRKTAQPEILCYFYGVRAPIPYTKIDQFNLNQIVGVSYAGLGHTDDAMTKLPWAELTGLRNLYIRNALVESDAPFQSQGEKILFPYLESMRFSGCKLGSKALDGFVVHSTKKLTELDISRDCLISSGTESQKIEKLKSAVNPGRRSVPDHGGNTFNPDRSDNIGAGNDPRVFTSRHKSKVNPDGTTTHTSTLLPNQPPGQQSGHLSSHRRSRSLGNGNGRTSDGSSMLGGVSGRKNESRVDTGVGGNTITNMHVPSRASLYGGKSRYQSRNQSGFPESTGPARSIPVTQFKTRMYRPEIVVENGAAVRDYQKLVEDATDALNIIQQVNPDVKDNYLLFELAANETINIAYRGEDHKITSILDASIDTVRVHRGWRQVDRTISHETRAQIVLASLGIPPCPPDIAISNERSGLGQAIRAEFDKLKLRSDETDITVTIKRRG
jgi:hypothetical protein